jgi:hypothetical protein
VPKYNQGLHGALLLIQYPKTVTYKRILYKNRSLSIRLLRNATILLTTLGMGIVLKLILITRLNPHSNNTD